MYRPERLSETPLAEAPLADVLLCDVPLAEVPQPLDPDPIEPEVAEQESSWRRISNMSLDEELASLLTSLPRELLCKKKK